MLSSAVVKECLSWSNSSRVPAEARKISLPDAMLLFHGRDSTRLSSRPNILTRVLDPDAELLDTSVPLAQTLVHGLDTSLVENLGLHP